MIVRIGVTGHREEKLRQAGMEEESLRTRIRQALLAVRNEVHAPVRVISPLAEGADRLVAEEALHLGFELHCPLPFRQNDYEKDFEAPGSRDRFRALLARASSVQELDGSRAARAEAYEAVGREVLRQSDVLIAVWNGRAPQGRGGTGQIVREALTLEIPVLWIGPGEGAASLLRAADPPEAEPSARLRLSFRLGAGLALESGGPEEPEAADDGDIGQIEDPGA